MSLKQKMLKQRVIILLILAAIFSFVVILRVEAPGAKNVFLGEEKKETKPEVRIPESALVSVPYTVQAPFADWKTHEESCEEAAILMNHYFLEGDKRDVLDQYRADAELKNMKAWQIQNWGKEQDLSLEKVGELASRYYGHNWEVKKNVTAQDIKKEVAAGHPILVPVMTHSLKNPHYNVNDTYHILLIKGYDATGVITNDAGVKEGKGWHYSWDILFSAIDAQSQKMGQGRNLLILTK